MEKLELKFQEDVFKWLYSHRVWFFRTQMGNKSGIPDIVCCMFGRFVGLELKRTDGKGRATKQQEKICKDIIDNKGIGAIISSIEELEGLYKEVRDKYG